MLSGCAPKLNVPPMATFRQAALTRSMGVPLAICRPRVRPHDAADVAVAVEHVVIIVRPFAARARFRSAFQNEHGSD